MQEVRLIDAEMQRVIDFSEFMAQEWDARRDCEVTIDLGKEQGWASDEGWADGMRAYASKQAYIRRAQAEKWRKQFAELRMEAKRFLTVHTEEGLSIDPSTLLSASEVEDMQRRVDIRRKKRMKAKRVKANANEEPTDDDPAEGGVLGKVATGHDSVGEFTPRVKKGKTSRARSRRGPRIRRDGKKD